MMAVEIGNIDRGQPPRSDAQEEARKSELRARVHGAAAVTAAGAEDTQRKKQAAADAAARERESLDRQRRVEAARQKLETENKAKLRKAVAEHRGKAQADKRTLQRAIKTNRERERIAAHAKKAAAKKSGGGGGGGGGGSSRGRGGGGGSGSGGGGGGGGGGSKRESRAQPGWDESKFVRDKSGKFTFKDSAGNAKSGLQRGDGGDDVKVVQDSLERAGYSVGRPGVDGKLGPLTQGAIKEFQRSNRLPETGEADDATLQLLDKKAKLRRDYSSRR